MSLCTFPDSYLMSPEGGAKSTLAANQETVDLAKFLFLANEKKCDINNVTQMKCIKKYLNNLKEYGVGPAGQITKLTTLQHALKMLVTQIPDEGATADQLKMVAVATTVESKIGGIVKTLRKERTVIMKRKRDMFDIESQDHLKVLSFLGNKELLALIQSWAKKDTLTEQEQLTMRRYLMCRLVYENAQRQGAVVNMKLEEQAKPMFQTTSDGKKMCIYKVWDHKTAAQFGSANIVTSEEVHNILCTYIEKYRPQPQPEYSEYIFLTPGGHLVTHVSDDMRHLSKTFPTEHGEIVCTATQMRKLTATRIAQESKDETTVHEVATHMTHSTDTAKLYYQQLQSTSGSVRAFNMITQQPLQTALPQEPLMVVKKPKRMWLAEEEKVLQDTFQLNAKSNAPKLEECDAFLQAGSYPHLFVGRTKKEVVDKCRTIIRQLRKKGVNM